MSHDGFPEGVVVLDKPAGLTSQQAVNRVKHRLADQAGVPVRRLKVGHAGTLDPMATGVLVVGVGRATRLLGYIAGHDKRYEATIRLGQATTTDDAEGEPLGEPIDATRVSDEAIGQAIAPLTGDIEQVPSAVSAIKVDGKRAYALARAGETVVLKPRQVTVSRFEVVTRHDDDPFCDIDVVVECSSGTYVRALARDLGASLGVGGHLTALRRTRVGIFGVAGAAGLDTVTVADIRGLDDVVGELFPVVQVMGDRWDDVRHGRALSFAQAGELVAVFGSRDGGKDTFMALYRPEGNRFVPAAVFVDDEGA